MALAGLQLTALATDLAEVLPFASPVGVIGHIEAGHAGIDGG